jgi:hypothetical protein
MPKIPSGEHFEWVRLSAQWDLMHALIETEYSDVAAPVISDNILTVYCAGHFLCGWEGDYPGGLPVIY